MLGSKMGRRWRGQGMLFSSYACKCVWVGGGGRGEAEGSGNDLDGSRIGGRAGWERGDDIEQAGGGETIWRGS